VPRFEIKATELTDTDVNFIALVKRGANRIPFRITKKDDEPMLDLYKIGRQMFKKADTAPTVVAIIAGKATPNPAKVAAIARACGLPEALHKSEEAGVVTLARSEGKVEDAVLVKLDDGFAVAVKGSEMLQKMAGDAGFVLSLSAARSDMNALMKGAIARADTPAEAAEAISKAAEDFRSYAELLTAHMPEAVFKAEQALKACRAGDAKGGAATDQETGDGLGDKANGAARKDDLGDGDTAQNLKDPEMPDKNDKTGTRAAKADAGKNGTGAGFELGQGTGTDDRSTQDDKNEEIDAAPGGRVSGDNSGLPARAKAPTRKELGGGDGGAHTSCPTELGVRTVGSSGEGARQAPVADATDNRPEDNADSDDADAGGKVAGKRKGKTLDMSGVPAELQAPTKKFDGDGDADDADISDDDSTNGAQSKLPTKAKAPTTKNDGDAEIGRKGKGKELPDEQSGSGAQAQDVQTFKSDVAIMQAISALAKSVESSIAGVTKTVSDLSAKVDAVTVMAKKTDAALSGTVFNEESEDRQVWTRKDDKAAAIPLLDTAYNRRGAA
jgi:hypothetical protein